MTTAAPATLRAELRAAIGKGFVAPITCQRISEKPLGYFGETRLNEYRVTPIVTGSYAEVAAEAQRRNAELMPYPDVDRIPIRFYPHPIGRLT